MEGKTPSPSRVEEAEPERMASSPPVREQFSLRYLKLPEDKTLPRSLPLILPSTHTWDGERGKVVEKHNPLAGLVDDDGVRVPRRPPAGEIKLEIVPDALALLSSVQRPLAVLSICGPFRSGKSYFLSRLLGKEFFEVGHGMKACTIGLWMSTALLEGEDYSILLVDTQGVDSISATESIGSSLMSVTALLSSFLIYNSRKVPNTVDIEKLRICVLLSSTILCQVSSKELADINKKFFPNFLWLLRDSHLQTLDSSGRPLDLTSYIRSRVLKLDSSDGKNEAGKEISGFFRSLECRKLPLPSITPIVLKDMFGLSDRISKVFTMEMSKTFDLILQSMSPKTSMDGATVVDGKKLAELVRKFVDAVNTGNLPDFRLGWMAQVRLRCQEEIDKIVATYRDRMNRSIRGNNLPMEEETIAEMHGNLAEESLDELNTSLGEIDPPGIAIDRNETVHLLEGLLAQYDAGGKVVGGALYPYVVQNHSLSKETCEALWAKLVKECNFYEKVSQAVRAGAPFHLTDDIQKIEEKFLARAVGPAKREVLEKSHMETANQSVEMLSKLPGMPRDFRVIGASYNKIKLSWDPPIINPHAVVIYRVQMRMDGGEWKIVSETSRTRVLITNLVDSAKYEFSVVAVGEELQGQEVSEGAKTKVSGAREFAVNLASGAFPVIAAVNHFLHERQRGRQVDWAKAAAAIVLTTAVTPATVVGFPFSGPLLAISLAHDDQLEELSKSWGDITPDEVD